ncbi:hypothetical protein WA556_006456 [Blastocystis sp. ATCC 50177/Nand II]
MSATGAAEVFGIDLGTTNSVAAIFKNGKVDMVVDKNGSCITPSYVHFPRSGNPPYICGFIAKEKMKTWPKEVVHNCKRLIGAKYDDPIVKVMQKSVAFSIVDDGNNKPMVAFQQNGEEKRRYPEQVSSYILEHLKKLTQTFAGFDIKDVVITVPARYTQIQRQIVRDAASIAGLNAADIIPEPVAAAYAYADVMNIGNAEAEREKIVLIYDLGGGTFDVTIMKINGMEFTELALGGDPLLGGSDFDRMIRDDVIKTYREEAADEYGELSKRDIDKLLKKCEDAKIDLRALLDTEIVINDDIDWMYNLSRSHMNSLIGGKIDESIRLCDEAIARAGLTVDGIDEIVLVGGSTRLCIVEEKLKKHFPQLEIKQTVNPDECVAVGAAKYAYAISTGKIKRNGINVTPICPSNIGIQGSEGEMIVLISAGDELPCKKTQTVSNTEDYVRRIPIRVYQGNDPMCANNTKLKQVNLTINHPGIAGENVFEISCSLDQMGNLTLGVKDANKNGPEKKIRNFQATWTAEEIKSLQQQLTHDTAELEAYNQIQERANSLINRTSAMMTHMPDDKRKSVESLMREWSIHPDTSVLDRLEELLRESRKQTGNMLIPTALSGNNLDKKDRPSLSVFTTVGGTLSCRIMLCDFTESKGITMGVRNVVTSEG